jgi:hypothetical protein
VSSDTPSIDTALSPISNNLKADISYIAINTFSRKKDDLQET